ncbi:MAG: response regulator transcription factor [Elusimicrobia bacterium]|nr:response regulator transcription factor [Elusimicrobiota bacterium]
MADIVICDDDRRYFELAAAYLRFKGHRVSWAHDPTELYLMLKGAKKPDLVILDTQMPEGGGAEAARVVDQKFGPQMPTLICSALAVEHQQQWFPPRPNRRYVAKPVKVEQLGALVDELLQAPPPSP